MEIDKRNIEDIISLTPLQEGMLFHYLKNPQGLQYHQQLCLVISGKINREFFEKAWNFVIRRNEMLRTVFRWKKLKEPVQVVLKNGYFKPRYYDCNNRNNDKAALTGEIKTRDRQETFNLREVPFRVTLCKLEEDRYEIIISHHHILYDGWSYGIILREFINAYHCLYLGKELKNTAAPKRKFKEFVDWIHNQDKQAQKQFWTNYLKGFASGSELSIKKRKTADMNAVDKCQMIVSRSIIKKARQVTRRKNVTLASLLYGTWGVLLQKYNDETDIVFGITVSGRTVKIRGIENIVGLFINTTPLRMNNCPFDNVWEIINNINEDLLKREEHENTPLVDINSCSEIVNKEDLFDTIMVIENYPLDKRMMQENSNLDVLNHSISETSHYDLTAIVEAFEDFDIKITFIYNRESFEKELILGLSNHFRLILLDMINNPGKKLKEIDMVSPGERARILYRFNRTEAAYPGDRLIHEWVEMRAKKTPDKTALMGMGQGGARCHPSYDVTYSEFNRKANQLGSFLRSKGVRPEMIIGIMAERSIEMIIGIYGILKAGGVYLPIDPETPGKRLQHMLNDSQVNTLLVQDKFVTRLKTGDTPGILNLEDTAIYQRKAPDLPLIAKPGNLVYVLYTSGSTGNPKGVMIRHCSLVNRLNWMQKRYPLDKDDVIMQKTPVIFDVSLWELFWWSISGASVCLIKVGDEKNPQGLVESIAKNNVTTIHFVPSMLTIFLEYIERASAADRLRSLSQVFASGEALGRHQVEIFNRQLFKKNKSKLINLYGPTEATVDVSYYDCVPGEKTRKIPIGKPIDNIKLWVMSRSWQIQPVGLPGELGISGLGLARGYLNNPEMTAEKFDHDEEKKITIKKFNKKLLRGVQGGGFLEKSPPVRRRQKIYKTGDLARWLAEGNIEFLGRCDRQVKIRGFRIELGEIEERLRQHQDIKEAVVVAPGDEQSHLYAYIVSNHELTVSQLREFLSQYLPEYMIPSSFTRLEKLARLPNGKIDRRHLPAPGDSRPNLGVTFVTPGSEVEQKIADTWKDILKLDSVGIHDNFFDLGGNSLMIIRVNSRLAVEFGKDIPLAVMFRCPTIHSLARWLVKGESDSRNIKSEPEPVEEENRQREDGRGTAVIGMAGRFPGARHVNEFWENLKHGKESITFFSRETLRKSGLEEELLQKPNYVNAQGVLQDMEYFDAGFFGYTPREAEIMDPQIRIFHECSWEALEDAGYDPGTYNGAIGLYAGASPNLYWEALSVFSRKIEVLGVFTAEKLMNKDYLTKWISYKFNLKGPSLSIYTACSTSLVAIHLACQALANNECDMALVGGITTVPLPDKTGYLYQEGMVMSPDGHCRAFDAQCGGFVGGKGVGVVLLKSLAKAVKDRDNIYAFIKGSAANNDGIRKVGFTAPSVEGQVETLGHALKRANIPAESIGFIDAHGTGTELGDTVEIEALKLAFNTDKKGFCGIGSVKTNIGHLDTAAGIASFIKVVLALKHRMIPPTLNFNIPNPRIDFINSPFYVNTKVVEWENGPYPLRAGVNSLGIGGTNAHVVLEEWPEDGRQATGGRRQSQSRGGISPLSPSREYQLILLSAKTPSALDKQRENLAAYLKKNTGIHLADAAYTLQVGRRAFDCREMQVARGIHEMMAAADSSTSPPAHRFCVNGGTEEKCVVFLFSTAPPHCINRGLRLYRAHPLFSQEADRWMARLKSITGKGDETFSSNSYGTAAAFIFQYVLARWLMKLGVKPDAMAGDCWGEYTAACLSGIFSPADALELVILRSYLIESPEGNPMRGAFLEKIKAKVEKITFGKPSIPYISSMTGKWTAVEEAAAARYWLNHASQGNKSWVDAGIKEWTKEWTKEGKLVFIGWGDDDFVNRWGEAVWHHINGGKEPLIVNMLTDTAEGESDHCSLLNHLGCLWLYGLNIDWSEFYRQEKRYRISLPTYPFEGQRYWIEGNPFKLEAAKTPGYFPFRKNADISRWFYIPLWKQSGPLMTVPEERDNDNIGTWLVFADESNLGSSLVNQLKKEGGMVIIVGTGTEFTRTGERSYVINPRQAIDYELLFKNLQGLDSPLNKIIHLWGITGERDRAGKVDPGLVNRQQILGFYSLLYIARVIGKQNFTNEIRVMVVTDNMQNVTGEESLAPGKATVLGPCKVIPQEFSNIRCCSMDIVLPEQGTWQQEKMVEQLLTEFRVKISDTVVAYRNNCRWVRAFEPLPLENLTGKSSRLHHRGVYLVTGGLGGVGLILAESLARRVQARLVLTGRSTFPAAKEWDQWLNSHEQDHPISTKIRKIQEFEKLGAEVMVFNSDTANEDQMREMVTRVEAQWGPINGVIHAAAAMGESLFKTVSEVEHSDCIDQFKPKMQGIMVLERVLKEKALDFCLLMSSTASVLGGLGFCAYSAANNFMDAFARRHNRIHSQKWLIVNWEGWQLENRPFRFEFKSTIDELLMTPGEGVAVFQRILAHPEINELLVSSGDLQYRIGKWIRRDSPEAVEPVQTRKGLSGAYAPPGSQQEKIIARVWQKFFAIDRVGVDDNLFELGATSLDIIQLNANLRKALKKNVPILTLFTYPTVRSLARNLLHEETGMGVPDKNKQRTHQVKMGKESMQARRLLRIRGKNQKND